MIGSHELAKQRSKVEHKGIVYDGTYINTLWKIKERDNKEKITVWSIQIKSVTKNTEWGDKK